MKVALIFPPYKHKKFAENVNVVDEEFGCYPPLALAYTAAILENKKHDVIIIDSNALSISKEETLEKLKKFNPDVISFNLHSVYSFFDTLEWIRYFKQNTKLPIVAGGNIVPVYPREIMKYNVIDYIVLDNSLKSLPKLLYALDNKKTYNKIKGIGYRKNNSTIVINKSDAKDYYCNLDELFMPARHLLPNDKYYSFISKKKNFTIMLTSRGCPYNCVFCAIRKDKYLQRNPKKVVDEIEICIKKHGIREIDFFDATFTANKKWVSRFCAEIKKRNLVVDWSCRTRVDCVDDKLLYTMANVGCKRIYYGIESADEEVLNSISKEISFSQVKKAIILTKKHGIKALGFFMIGNPNDTKKSVEKTIQLAKGLSLDYVQFSRTIPKPGTDLEKELSGADSDYWRNYIKGIVPERRIKTNYCKLSDKEIEYYTKKAYITFYLRPKYVYHTLGEIRSYHEFKRYIKAGLFMIMSFFSSDNS